MIVQSLGVVVGVDGSGPSVRALDWAAEQAALGGGMLTICHMLPRELTDVALPEHVRAELADRGQALLDLAAARAREGGRRLVVEDQLARGPVVPILLDLAGGADELVLGSRGSGPFAALPCGTVGMQVAAGAHCPVTVVGGAAAGCRDVVIGVDCVDPARAAVDFGFRFAADRGLPVHVVHAQPAPADAAEWRRERAAAREQVWDAVGPWVEKYPGVRTRVTVAVGRADAVLVEASHGCTLLVVGSRGRGKVAGLLLGSVSQAVLRHAGCPVTVAH